MGGKSNLGEIAKFWREKWKIRAKCRKMLIASWLKQRIFSVCPDTLRHYTPFAPFLTKFTPLQSQKAQEI